MNAVFKTEYYPLKIMLIENGHNANILNLWHHTQIVTIDEQNLLQVLVIFLCSKLNFFNGFIIVFPIIQKYSDSAM